MILYRLQILITLMSIVYIYIVPSDPFVMKLVFKLIPMVIIVFYALRRMPTNKQAVHHLILIGLLFSMIGDMTIHWFVVGLSAFLIGHLFYITGFTTQLDPSWPRAMIGVPLLIYAVWFGSRILPALASAHNDVLMIPVIVYIAVISIMVFMAFMTGNIWVMLGGFLFVISDSILAWNMFITPVDPAHEWLMLTYYGAQFSIAQGLHNLDRTRKRMTW